MQFKAFSRRLAADEGGATLIEYALIAALVSIGIIGALSGVARSSTAGLDAINRDIQNAS